MSGPPYVPHGSRPAEGVFAFYNRRGTCEQWIKEGKNAIKWTLLLVRRRRGASSVAAPAYNLANFMRTLGLPEAVAHGP